MENKKLKIGSELYIEGKIFFVFEGPVHDDAGESYILTDENNLFYDLDFQEGRIVFADAKRDSEGTWTFSNFKIFEDVLFG
jgi:hypothetical protein